MSSKGRQQVMGGLGRELAAALEGSVAAAREAQEVRLQIVALLERHAAESRRVVGRGVLWGAFIALLVLVPMLALLWVALLC